jgi:hypothetical protein
MVEVVVLGELLSRPVAAWVIRILAYLQTPLTEAELLDRVGRRAQSHNIPVPTAEALVKELAFLVESGFLSHDARGYSLRELGANAAKELVPRR